jgi:hypothetical protein
VPELEPESALASELGSVPESEPGSVPELAPESALASGLGSGPELEPELALA